MRILIHPTLPFIVREDGAVAYFSHSSNQTTSWTVFHDFSYGSKNKRDGYMYVKTKKKTYAVHRLVAETFLNNPDNKPTVDHINRIRDDNRVENLRFATQHEQRENSSIVLNRKDYGVRKCENNTLYTRRYSRDYYWRNPEKHREYALNWYHNHKEEINSRRRQGVK